MRCSFCSLTVLSPQIALTSFYGIGRHTALRVMARYSIHEGTKVGELTQAQITSLTSFLSSPATSPRPPVISLAKSIFGARLVPETSVAPPASPTLPKRQRPPDRLADIKIETDLRREILENIAHQRTVGSYVGRRHAMQLPVRGQNTRSNARNARKLNRVERRHKSSISTFTTSN